MDIHALKKNLYKPTSIRFFLFLMVGLISLLSIQQLIGYQSLIIQQDGLILRKAPSTTAHEVTRLPLNGTIDVLKEEEGWIKARYNGIVEGWLPEWQIAQKLSSDQNISVHFTQAQALYQSDNRQSPIIETVPPNTYLPINFIEKNWAQVTYKGKPAFLPIENLSLVDTVELEQLLAQEKMNDQERNQRETEQSAVKNLLIMRQKDGYLLQEPDLYGGIVYQSEFLQEFKKIDYIETADYNAFYLAEDSEGVRGYLNAKTVSEPVYSLDHRFQPLQSQISQATVMIDPGHGGEDPGTLSIDQSHQEKTFTLKTALKLKETLEAFGAKVILTNDRDQFISLKERTDLSNSYQPDLFISLHFDASYDTSQSGIATYFYHLEDEGFASTIHQSLQQLGQNDVGVQFGNFQVIRENTVPALLLELGYITNDHDLNQMLNDDYLQQLADAITDGLVNYFKQVQTQANIQ